MTEPRTEEQITADFRALTEGWRPSSVVDLLIELADAAGADQTCSCCQPAGLACWWKA